MIAYDSGLRPGSLIVSINGDTESLKHADPQEYMEKINKDPHNVIYFMGPPAKDLKCSDPQNYFISRNNRTASNKRVFFQNYCILHSVCGKNNHI